MTLSFSEEARLDKWCWAARFFKTRALAQVAIETGKVKLRLTSHGLGNEEGNWLKVKASRQLKVGDVLQIHVHPVYWEVEVKALSQQRGPASFAKTLYEETPDGLQRRLLLLERLRLQTEPAQAIKGRPTKQDRRTLESWRRQSAE